MTERRLTVVLTTVTTEEEAARCARVLVEERLAACVKQLPVGSTYRWEGKVEVAEETLLIIKTATDLLERLERRVRELSGYEVHEFIALDAAATSDSYLEWLLDACPSGEG